MKIEIIEETKDKIKFKMYNSRYTIPGMLKKQLLTHKEVTMASGMLKHPEDKDAEFILVVKNANPREVLLKSVDELQKEITSFKEGMLKEIPKDTNLHSSSFVKRNQEKEEIKSEPKKETEEQPKKKKHQKKDL
ncbi:MAG: hypothetical protein COT14_03555 [Candidatus Diapherotrites archaeon CG08_land_8_20_14_0_20_30_16]|nr:MAG: hypothetical protein COT14_03555 [Candidatus Diapherotrites archaeon CG08_land_8_20_14_0_20_30_16]